MRSPKVLSGTRGPEARQIASDVKALDAVQALIKGAGIVRPTPVGAVVYKSNVNRLRLLLEAPMDTHNPLTGKRESHRGRHAQFDQGVYISKSQLEQEELERHRSFDKDGNGSRHGFWRQDAETKLAVGRAVRELLAVVKNAPAAMQEDLQAGLRALTAKTGTKGFRTPEVQMAPEVTMDDVEIEEEEVPGETEE